MEFSSGINAIIGPNGCGKTNIVDAIRWVMGEQKTRLLRNTKMENVIFNGTKLRKPLGMAEVKVTLSNEDRAIPLDYSEITISRKIHRDGISEYYFNGELTRLKTIKSFLVDTGLGNHAYAIIEREMIDSVLSEKEQDKRYLFEEAAGIMRYRLQREEALRKIKHTETDLLRLGDILAELEREIRSLRYQMGKARRYTRLKEKVDRMEIALLKHTLHELLGRKEELKKELEYHKGITLTDENEITILENRLQELRIRSSELERRLQGLHENRYSISQSLKGHEEKIAVNTERITTGNSRIEEDHDEIEKAKERLEASKEDLLLHGNAITSKEASLEQIGRELGDNEELLRRLTGELDTAKRELRDRKQLVLDLVEEKAKARGLRDHIQKSLGELEGKRDSMRHRLGSMGRDKSDLSAKLSDILKRADERRGEITRLEEMKLHLAGRLDHVGELSARCDDVHSGVVRELGGLKEKQAFLQKIKQEHHRSREDVQGDSRIKGVLADFVKIKKEHRACFEACLSPVLQSLLAKSRDDALSCVHEAKGNGNGRVQILYPDGNGAKEPRIKGAGVLGSALSLVQCDRRVSEYLSPYLSGVVVVRDVDAAISLLNEKRAARIATLDGVFFDGPGKIVVAGTEEVEPTILEYETKITELDGAIVKAERKASILDMRKTRLAGFRKRLVEESARIRADLGDAYRLEKQTVDEQRGIEIDLARMKEKCANLVSSLEDTEASIGELCSRLPRLEAEESRERETVEEAAGADLPNLEDRIIELEREREAVLETVSRLKLDKATISGEVSTVQAKIRNATELETELKALIDAREEDIKRCRLQIATAEDEIEALKEGISRFHKDKDAIEKKIEQVNQTCEEIDKTGGELDAQLKEIKTRRDEKKENVERCTVELAALGARISSLLEKGRESYNEDLNRIVEGRETADPSEWEGLDKDELAVLKEQLEHVGPVNMLAVQEYEEKKERFDFLSKQKTDLEEAKESLIQAIRKINREARRLLSDTFEQVRENFKQTFQTLFGGGEADLLFVDSDDPLEANIKIVANPKGKRLHDISSLSGGERALTALSLLFAIYLVKPSPFCVLDEVDAPLDDANVARFINMLRSFTDRTQFIVITHNKKTMEAADYLYGVTMEEPGVSTLISVHFADVDRFRREAANGAVPVNRFREIREEVPART